MTALVGALVGAFLAAGVGLVFHGLLGADGPDERTPLEWARIRSRVAVIGGGFVLGWALTGWPAAGGLLAAVGAIVPNLVRVRRSREESLALTEALAGWAEMLRDTIVSHAGLREAIGVTAEVAPVPVRAAVQRLVARAERESLALGLSRFAREVDDPVADLIVAALGVAADGQARNLPALLAGIAASARSEAHMRLRVETGRARTYSSSRALIAITFGLSVSLMIFAPGFMAPFSSFGGQLVLLLITVLFGGALWGLIALSQPAASPRLLAGVADRPEEVLP